MKRRPTAWRWALVALWDALAHALAANRPAGFRPEAGLRELPRLFHAVCGEHPELPQVEQSVETLNDLRTQHISLGVTRWPVDLKKQLPGIFHDCLRVLERLMPGLKKPEVVAALLEHLTGVFIERNTALCHHAILVEREHAGISSRSGSKPCC